MAYVSVQQYIIRYYYFHIKILDNFDEEVISQQVKYMGLVEILRIRKAGFAYRGQFEIFLNRYKCLCPDTWPDWTRRYGGVAVEAVKRLIEHLQYTSEDYKIGR